jgi:hypothetical protein
MKKIKMIFTAAVLIASTWLAKSQSCSSSSCSVNSCEYICNGSFEYNTGDPNNENQVSLSCGWINGTTGTTADYYTSNGISGYDIPCNNHGNTAAHTGTAYIGFLAHYLSGSWVETVSADLKTNLVLGTTYKISFWLALSSNSLYNTNDNVGVRFVEKTTGNFSPDFIVSTSGQTTAWKQYTVSYTPTVAIYEANLNQIQVGALFSTLNQTSYTSTATDCSSVVSVPTIHQYDTYYFLEDVSVTELITPTITSSSASGCAGESFSLTATGADSYTWAPGTPTGSLSCYSCSNPISTYSLTTPLVYTITGATAGGCSVITQTISISPYSCCQNPAANNITLRDVKLVTYSATPPPGVLQWSSLTSGGFYTGTICVPSNSVITNTLTIVNTLSVSTTLTFNTCNIVICEDDVIQQYSVTTIDHSLLKGDVSTLWEGIWSYGKSLTVTNSWIEDAHLAINLGNIGYTISTHDGLLVDNVMFNKNYTALATGAFTVNPGNFKNTGNIYTCRSGWTPDYTTATRYTSTYNPSIKPGTKIKGSTYYSITNNTIRSNVGILIGGTISNTTSPTHITIGNVDATNTPTLNATYTNRFDYLNLGIYNANGKVNVYNNQFSNMITLSTGTAIGAVVHASIFGGYASTKIGALGGGSSPTSFYKNVFGPSCSGIIQDGVYAVGGGSLDVSYNDFCTISRYGVNVQSWNAPVASSHTVLVSNNSFSNTSYAFYANNNQTISASVNSNTLVQTASTYTATGYGAYINEVSKPANATYTISDNNFSQGLNSIYITNTKNAHVVNNTISVKKPSSTSIYNGGVWLDNDENTFVKGNLISCNPTNSSSWNTFGIFQSASIGGILKCNTIYSVSACIKAQSTCSPTTMYYNSLNNTSGNDACLYGLWLDQSATFGDIGYKNGSTWEQSDDIWGDFLTGSGGGDTYCHLSSNPNTSPPYKIYYDNSNSGPKPLSLYQPQVNLNSFFGSDISQSFSATPNGTTNSQGCSETSRLTNSSLTSPGRNVGSNLNGINNALGSSYGQLEGEENMIQAPNKKLIILKISDGNVNAKQIANNDDAFWLVDSLMTAYTQSKNGSVISSAINNNSAIVPQNTIEQNQKTFNGIYCIFLQADSLVNAGQIQTIQNLASLCPFTDGLAVYQARALIRNWDDSTSYYNSCENNVPNLNNSSKQLNQSDGAENNKPIVYPNPTNGSLVVKSNCKDCIFEVYDLMGKKVMSQKLNETETKVDVSSLNSGTYLYKIMQNGALLKADKLILTK